MKQDSRIDRLVGEHAANLSERLQAHRQQLFLPDTRRQLRKFTSGEDADLLGVKDAYLRKLHLDGREPEIRAGGRRYSSPEDIQALRVMLEKGAKTHGTYLPGRREGDHLHFPAPKSDHTGALQIPSFASPRINKTRRI
jgi:chromosome partitioning protein